MVGDRLLHAIKSNRRLTIEMRAREARSPDSLWLGELVEPEWLAAAHATVLHIGKAADLLAEIAEINPMVSSDRFVNAFRNLELVLSQRFGKPVPAIATRLDVLERETARYLVFVLDRSPELERIRAHSHELFMRALMELGIDDPRMFERTSPAIDQISPNWLPHITIRPESSPAVRPKYNSGSVDFVLAPPVLRI